MHRFKYLIRERVRSTFMENFKTFLEENVSASRRVFDWHDPVQDKEGKYLVDCRINGMAKPILVYGMPSDDKVRDVTISLLQFERWGVPMRSLGIF